ncbi:MULTISPECIES: DUF3993 domain-containing protein [Robertmurraya]|uniref:DUF3993 domain-containing protein n=1 Tax=Robertmurraya beringensis TaxID=641660 RepID=A0ABV6KQI7_9BACI
MGRNKRMLLLVFSILFFFPLIGQAAPVTTMETREDVLGFLHEAFQAQVSLSEVGRTEEEINSILKPYFTNSYNQLFKKENMVEENGLQFTYGTDFAPYYIPFFQFSDQTEIVINKNNIYVYEFFKGVNEGPVIYKDHYEAIILKKEHTRDWKISEYVYDFNPSTDIAPEREEEKKNSLEKNNPLLTLMISTLHHIKLTASFFNHYIAFGNE